MSNQETQKQAILDRLDTLSRKVNGAYSRAATLLDYALTGAATLQLNKVTRENVPVILTEAGIVEMTRLKNDLAELNEYYINQKSAVMATLLKNEQVDVTDAPVVDPAQQAQELARVMRERAAQLAAQPPAPVVPTVTEPLGLPAAEAVIEEPAKLSPPAVAPVPENSLDRLAGRSSPLLDIFAPGPWLPEGKGLVTVGTYPWYKSVNPAEKPGLDRAKLPTGFYGDNGRPTSVLLRLETCIIHWTFGLNLDAMSVFMVGLSNTDPNIPRWFNPKEMTASYTRRLIQELEKEVEKHKSA